MKGSVFGFDYRLCSYYFVMINRQCNGGNHMVHGRHLTVSVFSTPPYVIFDSTNMQVMVIIVVDCAHRWAKCGYGAAHVSPLKVGSFSGLLLPPSEMLPTCPPMVVLYCILIKVFWSFSHCLRCLV